MSGLLQDGLRASVARHGAAVAVVLGDDAMSYAALEAGSNRLARVLRELGVGRGDRVALLVAKTPAAVVGMHAVLKAGAAYVPVDLASPAARAALVLRAAEPAAVLADAAAAALLAGLRADGVLPGLPVVAVDGAGDIAATHGPEDWAALPAEPDDVRVAGGDLAHILFTSGSTGVPKGVQITHAMALAFIAWALGHFGTRPGERVSGHPPLHFDLSTFDVYATLAAGAELHLVPAGLNLLPGALASFIRDRELVQWFSVPSTFAYVANAGAIADGDFPALRRVLFCGEPMPAPVLAHWMRRVPHARYTNLYGPTETTIASTYYDVPSVPEDLAAPLPIGVPCAGEEVLVLDEALQPVPPGEIGQLHIAGVGLSPGYWRDDQATARAFVPDPRDPGRRLYRTGDLGWLGPDGDLRFAGRLDSQIKHRGYRIELGEIEAAVSALDGVAEVAVVAVDTGGFEANAICCAFAAGVAECEPAALRAALRESLPAHMIPTRWLRLERLPKNQNGKVDRRELRERFSGDRVAAPATRGG